MPTITRKRRTASKITTPIRTNDPIDKIKAIEDHVNASIIGREELTRGIVLSLIAGQNILALGVPGTAKTMLVQAISESFATGANDVFDILLTKFTKANEVFGPVDIEALENGEYRINTDGYLATAKVGVIDEIFKGSSAILNALLRIANERTFRNGKTVEETPVRMLVGMSNEYPEDPALLAAFFDRFPSKHIVDYLDTDDFTNMLETAWTNKKKRCPVKISDDDFAEIDKRTKAVELPREISETLTEIRAKLNAKNVTISDRRWVQAVKLMAAHAVYHDRTVITRRDLIVLEHICWNNEADRTTIGQILPDYLNPFERDLRSIMDEVYGARQAILKAGNYDGSDTTRPNPDRAEAASEAAKAIVVVRGQTARLDTMEDLIEDGHDKILLQEASESIESVEIAVRKISKGDKDSLDALAATQALDVGV